LWSAAGLVALSAPFAAACGGKSVVNEGGDGGNSGVGGTGHGPGSGGTKVSSSGAAMVTVGPTTTTVSVVASSSSGGGIESVECFTLFDSPCPDVGNAAAVLGVCTSQGDYISQWISGPEISESGECCYVVIIDGYCGEGRPLIQDDAALTAALSGRDTGWMGGAGGAHGKRRAICELGDDERAALAAMWSKSGLFEHASVASFARFALELMAVSSPASLVQAAHEAALDEVVHARLCFALASRYAGDNLGPEALPITGTMDVRGDLATLAAATVAEGCIGETLASAVANAQLAEARDPEVRAALQTIAEDEARHAELAWRTVAWALNEGGETVRRAITDAFNRAHQHTLAPPSSTLAVAEHGLLDAKQHRDVQLHALTSVIMPCANALLAPKPATRAQSTHALRV